MSCYAQIITSSRGITTIQESVVKKERNIIPVEQGLEQHATFGVRFIERRLPGTEYFAPQFSFNYIVGKRLNKTFFAGFGTGFDMFVSEEMGQEWIYLDTNFSSSSGYIGSGLDVGERYSEREIERDSERRGDMPAQFLSVPMYAYFRAYLMQTRFAPFISVLAGFQLSTGKKLTIYEAEQCAYSTIDYNRVYEITGKSVKRYGAIRPMFEVTAGLNVKLNNKNSITLEFGYTALQGQHAGGNPYYGRLQSGMVLRAGYDF
mgnify:CR=1 FL=1